MIATILLAGSLSLQGDFEVASQELSYDELDARTFDRRWTLPEKASKARDLLAEMRYLSELRFRIDLGNGPEERCFGDLVAAAQKLDGSARRAWFAKLEKCAPELMEDWGRGLAELLLDDHLHSGEWRPARDHARDGLLIAGDWKLTGDLGAPWEGMDARFCQAAALLHADLVTIKEIENDYRRYTKNVGADYDWIYPKDGMFFHGSDPQGQPFSALAIRFRCDLPFPFSNYECDLRILNRVDGDGAVRTDIYSTSEDFFYLAGRDVFLSVRDSGGEPVAFLVVRHFGFDLRGVPDKPKHRLEGLRSSLGNLKRNSERRFSKSDRVFGQPQEAITSFRLLGNR